MGFDIFFRAVLVDFVFDVVCLALLTAYFDHSEQFLFLTVNVFEVKVNLVDCFIKRWTPEQNLLSFGNYPVERTGE